MYVFYHEDRTKGIVNLAPSKRDLDIFNRIRVQNATKDSYFFIPSQVIIDPINMTFLSFTEEDEKDVEFLKKELVEAIVKE